MQKHLYHLVLLVIIAQLVACGGGGGADEPSGGGGVTDSTPPVITILGDNPTSVDQNAVYTDAGATASDNVDGSVNVTSNGVVDTSIVGSYTITYTASDSSGNSSSAARTVNVEALPSMVTLNGKVVDEVGVGLAFLGLTFTAESTITSETNIDGLYEVVLPHSGTYDLKIVQGQIELFNQSVTVLETGELLDFGAVIEVIIPDDAVPLKDEGVSPPPPLNVFPLTPTSGQLMTVNIEIGSATNINLMVTGEGCGGLQNMSSNSNSLTQAETAGNKGLCSLSAEVTTPEGVSTITASYFVTPTQLVLPGVNVINSEYISSGNLPNPSGEATAPNITSVVSPGDLINGGTGTFQIQLTNTAKLPEVVQVLVKISGIDGYFSVPALESNGNIVFDMSVDQDFFDAIPKKAPLLQKLRQSSLGNILDMIIQLIDKNGNSSNQSARTVNLTQVGAGRLQVSLSWDTPTDVDLHVVEPSGEEIYFNHKNSNTGGVLDLDSNAGCSIDNVNNENVTWGDQATPANGEYIVRVDYWSACGDLPANYTVTTNNCGVTETFSGSFSAGDADSGSAGSGVEITRVNFTSCDDFRAAGRATYEDFKQTSTGLSGSATVLPIRHAKVEVKRKTDDVTLAMGKTDADGKFDITFGNDLDPVYYVVVIAEQDNAIVKQKVIDENDNIYSKKSDDVDGSQIKEKLDLKIEAKKLTAAPAFNIFDLGLLGAATVRAKNGVTPPFLTWLWTSGKKGSCGGNVSCYSDSSSLISVLSLAADPDEYDDVVLLHEYGHFYQSKFSKENSPRGSHSSKNRVDPRLAWGEGSATAFALISKKTSTYIDTNASSVPLMYDLEQPPVGRPPLGTSDTKIDGKVSEALVAAILWDLHDASNEKNGSNKPKDTVTNTTAIFNAFGYLKSSEFTDRGHVGVDLVDFLDGWFCLGNGKRGDANTGVEGIVTGMFEFPYDYVALDSCKP